MRLSDMRRDSALIEQGQWIGSKHDTPIPEMGDLQLRVRGDNNADWRRLQAKLIAAVPRGKKSTDGRLDPDEVDRINAAILLDACLLGWDGVEDVDGKPVPFSRAKAQELLTDPDFRSFRDAVVWAAAIVGKQAVEQKEADAKNS